MPRLGERFFASPFRERFEAKGHRVLVAQMTLTDPVFYTKPVVIDKKWRFDPKGILLPYELRYSRKTSTQL